MDLLPSRARSTGSTDDEVPADELKGWSVRFSPAHQSGGWSKLDGWESLANPPTKTEFEINTGELEPGTYRLFWIQQDTERLQVPPDEIGWKFEVDDDRAGADDAEELTPLMQQLERVDQRLARLENGGGEVDLMSLVSEPADLFVLMGAFDDTFTDSFGQQAALKQLGLIGGNELGFDDYKDNPIGAFFFDSYKEPQQLRELGQNLGAGGSAFVDGLLEGADDPESILADEIEEAERKAEAAENRDPEDFEPQEADSGPTTLDEMGIDKPEPTDVAQALDDSRRAAAPAQDGQDAVEAGAEGVGLSEAGAGEEPDLDASAGAEDDGTDANAPADEEDADEGDAFDVDLTDDDIAAAMEEL